MTPPTFTVVIAAFNERELIGDTIRSVQAQTRRDWEIVVVDDGSTDGTAEAVRPFTAEDARIRLVTQPNQGLSAARNTAIGLSEAPLLSWLDADDLWLPNYLEAMAAALDSEPSAGVAYTDAWALDADTHRFRRSTAMSRYQPAAVPQDPTEMMKLLVRQNFIWVSATVRRRALNDAGLFREDFRLTEDIELWFRILALGYRIVRARGVALGVKRERPEALSRKELPNVESLQRVMGVVAQNEEIPFSVRTLAAARIGELDRWRRAFSGDSRLLALGLAARLKLGAVKRAVLTRREWRREAPPEVREAFPDLQGN